MKIKWLVTPCCALLLALGGCQQNKAAAEIVPQNLSLEQREVLNWVGRSENVLRWQYTAPEGAKQLVFTMEYYRDGQRVAPPYRDATEAGMFEREAKRFEHVDEKTGNITVAVYPQANSYFGASLGKVDFFNRALQSQWNLCVGNRHASSSFGFTTGCSFEEQLEIGGKCYKSIYWHSGTAHDAALDEDVILCGFTIQENQSGDGFAGDLLTEPEWLENAAYAYLLKARFTA